MKKIVVLTSGGDSSGMNAYLKSLAQICEKIKLCFMLAIMVIKGLLKAI